ncbi:MAG TPA: D-glycerate dehydrogenase [Candidatus Kryptonia bacterium]
MKSVQANQRVVVTRRIPENGVLLLKRHFTVDMNMINKDLTPTELLRKLDGAFGVVAMLSNRFDKDVISRLSSIKVISDFAVGYNNIDVPAATRKGIVVTNTPGVLTDATADMAIGLLLATARRIAEGDRLVRSGKFTGWTPLLMLGHEVNGKTIGIIGAGRIGTAVARRSLGFRMVIKYFSHKRNSEIESIGGEFLQLEDLLSVADFVSVNVPLTDDTRGMIGPRELKLMNPDSIIINTARGEIIDEDALISSLKNRKIAGAGLDVYVNEPKINKALMRLDNVVLAPHLGSATVETRAKMSELAAANVIAVYKGERPPAIVNPEVLAV